MFLVQILNILFDNEYDVWGGKDMFLDSTEYVPFLHGLVKVLLRDHPIKNFVTKQISHPECGLKIINDLIEENLVEIDSLHEGFQRITYGDKSITSMGVKVPNKIFESYFNIREDKEFCNLMNSRYNEYKDIKVYKL